MRVSPHQSRGTIICLQLNDNNSRLALLQILEDCYQRKSVIVTLQLPVSKWYAYINEPTIADAVMDRSALTRIGSS